MRTRTLFNVRSGWGLPFLAAALCSIFPMAHAGTAKVTTFAGGYVGDGNAATSASLAYPTSVVRDDKGNLYVGDSQYCRVRKVNAEGIISTIAGSGICGFSGDGAAAKTAMISNVAGMTFDLEGNLLISDQGNERIRKITPAGIITTIAGDGTFGYSGDGGLATKASLGQPIGISVDRFGNLYIADAANNVIRLVDKAGDIRTVAGNHTGGFSGDGGPAISAELNFPQAVIADSVGNVYIADWINERVRKVDVSGIITTYAGNGMNGNAGSGGPATSASIGNPSSLLAHDGTLYVGTAGNVWAMNQSTDIINIIGGVAGIGFGGDGGLATSAVFTYVTGIAADGSGGLLLADSLNDRIRQISGTTRIVSTIAGGYVGDGGKATAAGFNFNQPGHTTFDAAGNFYIADGYDNRIRKVSPDGVITTFAGTGITGASGNGGPATSATLSAPRAVAADAGGDIFIADESGELRKVDPEGIITSFSNAFIAGGLAVDAAGNVYATDGLSVVWKISPSGSATLVAGEQYQTGYNGDGIPATQALLNFPNGLAVDGAGNLYISDWLNSRIRKVNTNGIISTVAGTGTLGFSGDGGLATAAMIALPQDVALDTRGNLYIADWVNARVRVVNASGIIETIAGTGIPGYNGDGLPATRTNLDPIGVTVRDGSVYVSDEGSYRVRKVN